MEFQLYGIGSNSHGQLGIDSKGQNVTIPTPIPLTFRPTRIHGGANHTILTDEEMIYTSGCNQYGQLGRPTCDTNEMSFSTFLPVLDARFSHKGMKILDIVAGWDFSLVLVDFKGGSDSDAACNDIRLFGFGNNQYGILGQSPSMLSHSPTPVSVHADSRYTFSKIACGVKHVLALSLDRTILYAWGDTRHGKIGQHALDSHLIWLPFALLSFPFHSGAQIVDMAAGHQHSVALSNQGTVYIWGRNRYNLMPFSVIETVSATMDLCTQIPLPYGSRRIEWKSICSCWHGIYVLGVLHSLSNENPDPFLLCWGRNDHHQITLDSDHPYTPTSAPTLHLNTRRIACGSEHILLERVHDSSYTLSAYGWNEHGNCNLHTKNNASITNSILFGCGYAHSFYMTINKL
jgi:alpha-tubulin suppressor-like RCC1 family protein